ncbi:MAG: RagB/SusD family nutrient uptake outer membrane protein [Ginsengibacter sp.]
MRRFKLNIIIKNAYWMISIAAITVINFSCKKFVQVGPPDTQVAAETVFENDNTATTAVISVYAQMGISYLDIASGGMTVYPALSADELATTTSNTELLSFQNNAVIADNGMGIYTHLWKSAYQNIYYANAVLEGVTHSKTITENTRNQLTGEMLVVRAINYFWLSNLFGDIPLELSTNYRVNSVMPRAPVVEVYKQLTTDLLDAEGLLKENYPSALKERANKWAAAALLARVYLYKQEWANAEAQASMIINSTAYSLEPDLNNVFSQSSGETIWQLGNDISNTTEAQVFVPYSSYDVPDYVLTSFLIAAFERGDQRFNKWVGLNTIDSTNYYYPYKYKDNNYDPVTELYIVLRLSEQYLIRAEARAEQDKVAEAIEDLNVIRSRAGLAGTIATSKSDVLMAIAHERQVELFCEWGHRWCDLKRTGKADEILGGEKAPNWQANDAVYPLPAVELVNNPFLIQNPGY